MKQTLNSQGLNLTSFFFSILSIAIIATSLYLTKHFFDANFPDSLADAASGLCNISSFFNCDSATYSNMAHFFGIPTGVFGLVFGICLLVGIIGSSEEIESQNKTLALINAVGCIFFLAYSLIILKSLCPFCTLYYLLSWTVLGFLHFKSSAKYRLSIKHSLWQIVLFAIIAGYASNRYHSTKSLQDQISQKIIQEYHSIASVGDPETPSAYILQQPTEETLVTISIFSDFQCPFCKKLALQIEEIKRRFSKNLLIQYYFFPLDAACNSEVKQNVHPYACAAAKLAACDTTKFPQVHDEIFMEQENLNDKTLQQISSKFSLEQCPNKDNFDSTIKSHVLQAVSYHIKSTPTFILNGKKIEGMVPTNHLVALIE